MRRCVRCDFLWGVREREREEKKKKTVKNEWKLLQFEVAYGGACQLDQVLRQCDLWANVNNNYTFVRFILCHFSFEEQTRASIEVQINAGGGQ